jgi:hypothetical protein
MANTSELGRKAASKTTDFDDAGAGLTVFCDEANCVFLVLLGSPGKALLTLRK